MDTKQDKVRQKENRGTEFKGLAGGRHYVRWASIFGMNRAFYRKAAGISVLPSGSKVLDLGCGPGSLSSVFASMANGEAEIIGIDISEDQLAYARAHAGDTVCRPRYLNMSMAELAFADGYFDIVASSMALHETPPEVRRRTIVEVSRVLKPGGLFIYTDWSKPRLGLQGAIWLPLICWGKKNHDNWHNVYMDLCAQSGLMRIEDRYINSIARRQVFVNRGR